jgi:hypothetical protein
MTTQPHPGNTQDKTAADLQACTERIEEINHILSSKLTKLTVTVEGVKDHAPFMKVIMFKDATVIPHEARLFFEIIMQRELLYKMGLENKTKLIKVGNHVVELGDFIKEYSSGAEPSITLDTAAKLQALVPGQTVSIEINGQPYQVNRIS